MSASWNVKIVILNITRKEVSLSATRTDGNTIRKYSIASARLNNQENKIKAIDTIWKMYEDELARELKIANVIGTMETQAANNLMNREI